jgi:hypothetical protein
MKKSPILICTAILMIPILLVNAKESSNLSNTTKAKHPIYDLGAQQLNNIELYLFKGDPLMTKRCLKRFEKKAYKGLLTPQKEGDILVAQRD